VLATDRGMPRSKRAPGCGRLIRMTNLIAASTASPPPETMKVLVRPVGVRVAPVRRIDHRGRLVQYVPPTVTSHLARNSRSDSRIAVTYIAGPADPDMVSR